MQKCKHCSEIIAFFFLHFFFNGHGRFCVGFQPSGSVLSGVKRQSKKEITVALTIVSKSGVRVLYRFCPSRLRVRILEVYYDVEVYY